MTWTPATIDTATSTAARLAFDAHDLGAQTDDRRHRTIAHLIEAEAHRVLAELPVGYPEIIEADANPGGFVAIIVDVHGHETRILFDHETGTDPVAAVWTPAVLNGTGWRLVIFDGDDGLCPLEVFTADEFLHRRPDLGDA